MKTVLNLSDGGVLRATMYVLRSLSLRGIRIAARCDGMVTRLRTFVYKRAAYAWNIPWNTRKGGLRHIPLRRGHRHRARKSVAEAAHRLDVGLVSRLGQYLPQPLYVDVHRPLVDFAVVAPDLREELVSVEGPPGMRHQ